MGLLPHPRAGLLPGVNRTPPDVERAVISIRRRLAARATPQTRYSHIGAVQIRVELESLGYSPLPSLRTIRRIIARAGLSCPPLRLSPRITGNEYPGPQAPDSNHLHQIDVVGPRYLRGDSTRYYLLVCKDVFDQSIYMELVDSCSMDGVLSFLGLGLQPPIVSWGVLLQRTQTLRAVVWTPWLLLPGLFVVIVVLAFNFVGDGLRDALDPYR